MTKKFLSRSLFALGLTVIITACSDDPDPDPGNVTRGNYVVGVRTDGSSSQSYLLTTDNLKSGEISLRGNGKEANESTIYQYNNGEKGFMFLYRQGDPATFQSCKFLSGGELNLSSSKTMPTREEFIGLYKNYVLAMTSVKLQDGKYGEAFNFIDGNSEAIETAYMSTENIVHEGEYANMGGLISIGDNIITALEPYQIPASGSSSQPTAFPDEMAIAILSRDGNNKMKVNKIIKDSRASYAVGRKRSGRLSCIGTAGDGNIYAFGPANQRNAGTRDAPVPENISKHPSSVLKINKTTLEFDKSYYYNIEDKSGGLKLQNAFPLYGNYFLLNMFSTEKAWNMQAANKFAIFNVQNGEFRWIEGLPASESIKGHLPRPYIEKETVYLPLSASAESFVYIINAETAKAVKGVQILETDITIVSVTKLNIPE